MEQIGDIDDEYYEIIDQAGKVADKKELEPLQSRFSDLINNVRINAGYTIFPVYHGSGSKEQFYKFKRTKSYRSNDIGGLGYNEEVNSPAFFFSNNKSMAHEFARNRADNPSYAWVHSSLALKISNPLDLTGDIRRSRQILNKLDIKKIPSKDFLFGLFDSEEYVNNIKRAGYDGAIVSESDAAKKLGIREKNLTYVVFEPAQIKFAGGGVSKDNGKIIPLSKRFDPTNDDIRY